MQLVPNLAGKFKSPLLVDLTSSDDPDVAVRDVAEELLLRGGIQNVKRQQHSRFQSC